eukprot:690795-Amphidinium_carterae.1
MGTLSNIHALLPNNVVDDISVAAFDTADVTRQGVLQLLEVLTTSLHSLGLPLSASKSVVLSKDAALVRAGYEALGGQPAGVTHARLLGVDVTHTSRRRLRTIKKRWAGAHRGLSWLSRHRRCLKKSVRCATVGPVAQLSWGCEAAGLVPSRIVQHRSRVVRASVGLPKRANVGLYLLTHDRLHIMDPGARVVYGMLTCWQRSLNAGRLDREVVRAALMAAAVRFGRSRRGWQTMHGPAGALVATCHYLGWELLDEHRLKCHTGVVEDLCTMRVHDFIGLVNGAFARQIEGAARLEPVHWPLVAALCRRSASTAQLRAHVAKAPWCPARLSRRSTHSGSCAYSGQWGDMAHRVFWGGATRHRRRRFVSDLEVERRTSGQPQARVEQLANLQ